MSHTDFVVFIKKKKKKKGFIHSPTDLLGHASHLHTFLKDTQLNTAPVVQ